MVSGSESIRTTLMMFARFATLTICLSNPSLLALFSGTDRNLKNAVAPRTKQIVRFHDVIEREPMGD